MVHDNDTLPAGELPRRSFGGPVAAVERGWQVPGIEFDHDEVSEIVQQ